MTTKRMTPWEAQLAAVKSVERTRLVRDVLVTLGQASVKNPHWSAATLVLLGCTLKGADNLAGNKLKATSIAGNSLLGLGALQEAEQVAGGIGSFIVDLFHGRPAGNTNVDAPVMFTLPDQQPNPFLQSGRNGAIDAAFRVNDAPNPFLGAGRAMSAASAAPRLAPQALLPELAESAELAVLL